MDGMERGLPFSGLSINTEADCISVAGRSGKNIFAAVKDIALCPSENDLPISIQEAVFQLDFDVLESLDLALVTTRHDEDLALIRPNHGDSNLNYEQPRDVTVQILIKSCYW